MSDWIQEVEEEKNKIKGWPLTDRLSIVSKLAFMNGTMAASVTGWNSWLASPLVMEQLTEDQLKELVTEFEKLALAFLELDLKYTKVVSAKQKETKAKKATAVKEKEEKSFKEKATYVA